MLLKKGKIFSESFSAWKTIENYTYRAAITKIENNDFVNIRKYLMILIFSLIVGNFS